MLSLAALAVLAPDERGFVENIFLKYEKKLYAAALGKRDYPREHMEHGRLMVFRPYPDRLRRFR